MGQQQLLLIILGVIVVGIAVAVGITMFNESAVSANRDAVTNDLVNLASKCQQYYRRPTALGGGGNSFGSLSMSSIAKTTAASWTDGNGTYSISGGSSGTGPVTLVGVGTENGSNGSPITVTMYAYPDSARALPAN